MELKFAEDFAYSHGLIDDHFYKVYKDKAAHCVSLIEAGFKHLQTTDTPKLDRYCAEVCTPILAPRGRISTGNTFINFLNQTAPPECLANLHQGGQLKEAEKFCEDSVRNLYASNTMQQSLLDTLGGTDLG